MRWRHAYQHQSGQFGKTSLGDEGDLSQEIAGAGEGIRTLDPNLGKVVLYP